MTPDTFKAFHDAFCKLRSSGPDRVLVEDGIGVTSKRAREEFNVVPDVVLIRNDGWMLGARWQDAEQAKNLYAHSWIGFIRRSEATANSASIRPISEWTGR